MKKEGIDNVEESRVKKLDDASKLELDESDTNAKIMKVESDSSESCVCKRYNQYAIVGFWKMDKDNEFYCYNFFYVPNPVTREFARSERITHIS